MTSAAQQQIEIVAVSRDDSRSPFSSCGADHPP
jgi:hypothetical protein